MPHQSSVDSEAMKNVPSCSHAKKNQLDTGIADFDSLREARLSHGICREKKIDDESEASLENSGSDDDEPEFFEPEDLLQLGASAAEAAGKVASAMGSELHAVKTKCVENAVGNRVANASWSFFARTVGNGWNTLSEAADFWANEVDAEESAYLASFRGGDAESELSELGQLSSDSGSTQGNNDNASTSSDEFSTRFSAYAERAPWSAREVNASSAQSVKPPVKTSKFAILNPPPSVAVDAFGPAIPPLKLLSSPAAPGGKNISRPVRLKLMSARQNKFISPNAKTSVTPEACILAPAARIAASPLDGTGTATVPIETFKPSDEAVVEDKSAIRSSSWLDLAVSDENDDATATIEALGDWECI